MFNKSFTSTEYKELRESERGKRLIEQSESDAANFLFELESGEENSLAASKLTAKEIYDAVTLTSSLSIEVGSERYTLEPVYPMRDEETALAILQDSQAAIERSLFNAVLKSGQNDHKKGKYSATSMEVFDVNMTDLVGDYDVPEEVPEWGWVEEKSCYMHRRNGEDGIWEFVVNLAYGVHNVPEKLESAIAEANRAGAGYILFHQGT